MIRDKNKMVAYLVSAGIGLAAAVSGAFLVAPSEGYNNNTYLDPVDIITSCYGHTGNDLKQGQTFTDEQCLDQLSKDLGEANDAVNNVIHVPLTLWQRAALISFTYNVGQSDLKSSTLAKEFNQKQYEAGCNELLRSSEEHTYTLKTLIRIST